jgi:glycosyltransferase involved in cell wall biosynthesis
LYTVRNGVDIQRARESADRAASRVQRERPYLLNIGTFEHKKAHDVLLAAFRGIAERHPHVDLVIVGRDGPTRPALESAIHAERLENRVTVLVDRPHQETLSELKRALVFVLPSRAEGLPLAILEAGALNVPVVATRVDGIPEVIDAPDRGWLVAPDDPADLEEALSTLIADAPLRSRLADSLHEHVKTHFSWRRAWEEYAQLIN